MNSITPQAEGVEINTDIEMILSPQKWPRYPFLPMKKWNEEKKEHEIGVIIATDKLNEVHLLNLHKGWTEEEFESAGFASYENINDMVADGWMVD